MLRSTRSARTAHISVDRFATIRAMGFALAGVALVAAAIVVAGSAALTVRKLVRMDVP